jgi:diguanylate cyclase (GGDEF)-like protein/PAS domain S-box-containing protein
MAVLWRSRYALSCALTAIVAAVWIWLIATGYGGPVTAQAVSNVGLASAALAAALGCAWAALRNPGRLGRVWGFLGLSSLSWGTGQVIWTWYESALGRDVPFPSFADIGYLGAVPFAAAALLSLPTAPQTMAGRIRTVIDGLMIACSMLLTSWVLVLGPLFHTGGDGLLSQSISLAYPIGDVVVVTIVLYVFLRARHMNGVAPLPLGLVGCGLVAIAVADSGFTYLTATEAYASGNLIDIGWFLGYTLILLAAIKPAQPAIDEEADQIQARPLGMFLPYVAVGVAMAVSSVDLFQTGGTESFVAWTRTLIVVLLVARQCLTVLENLSLTRHLEARVEDRTAELRASEQRFEALVQHSSDVVTIVDVHGTVLYQSESVHRVFGYQPDWMMERPLTDLLDAPSAASLLEALKQASSEPYALRVLELSVRHRDGHRCHAEMTITNLLENPSVGGLVLNTRDISERKALEDQLVHEAFHDSLTTLANRALFKDRVEHALRRRTRTDGAIGVLFLDLDGFKEVNDSLGHGCGDQLLVQVGERLRLSVRPGDTVARLGGDEFGVLIEDGGPVRVGEVADRMTGALREPFIVDGQEIHVRGSIGIATDESAVDDADQLLRNADLAMYRAKAAGEGGFERYDPDMHADLIERLQLGSDLRRALEADELRLHFQPTLALSSGAITGVEALIRWEHPSRGLVSPTQFIPLAEDRGLIHEIGGWVLKTACHQAVAWQARHPAHADLSVSVNISGRQLKHADLVGAVADALQESGLSAANLVLEITESVLMEHTEENLLLLRRLRAMGVRLAIDDFGTGYSSLSYLHRFPVDMLKIDRSFVDRLGGSADDAELVRTIVRLGQSLGMTTVAEGIEDHAQFLALKRIGCQLGQGFHFSKPVPADEIDRLLSEGEPESETIANVKQLPRVTRPVKTAGRRSARSA